MPIKTGIIKTNAVKDYITTKKMRSQASAVKKFIDDFDVVIEAVIVEAVALAKAAKRNTVMKADMAAAVESARLLTWYAGSLADQGKRFVREAAQAKFYATDVAMRVTTDAVQIHGGYGYTKDYLVEKLMRDAKLTQIYEGTNQVNRMVAGGALMR